MSSSYTSDQAGQTSGTSHTSHQPVQDTRPPASQYAELDPYTALQVCIGSAPEVVLPPIEPDITQRCLGYATSQVGIDEKPQGPRSLWTKLGRRKVIWLTGLAIAICIILAISISVPLLADKAGRSSGDDSEGPESDPASTRSNMPPVNNIPGCTRNRFTSNVDWVGIRDGKDWDFELKGIGSAEECCGYCYETAQECNAWLYVPLEGPGPDCTLIVKYGGDDPDDECPNGKPDVMFNMADDKPDNLAGMGPCASFSKWM